MVYEHKNRKNKLRAHSGRKKTLLIILVAVLVLGAAAGALWYAKKSDSSSDDAKKTGLNLSPPTSEEQKAGDNVKPEAEKQQQNDNQTPQPGKKAVVPTITYAGIYGDQVEVGGFVGTIFEEGGTCTLTLTKSGVTKTSSVKAVRGANSVDCPTLAIKMSELSPGTWQAVISYSSSAAQGQSEARPIEVQ